jgi:hypothetical protein
MTQNYRMTNKGSPWGMIATFGFAVILAAGVIAYFVIYGFPVLEKPGGKEPPGSTQVHDSKEFKYRFVFPKEGWKQDNETRIHLKANCLAMKRTNPNAWFTLAAREYRARVPDKEEQIKEAVKRLEGYFHNLEWDPTPDGFLAQKSAWIIVFQGKVENTVMRGECYTLTNEGITYWFTTWSSASDAAMMATEWPKIRERFTLLAIQQN